MRPCSVPRVRPTTAEDLPQCKARLETQSNAVSRRSLAPATTGVVAVDEVDQLKNEVSAEELPNEEHA